MKKNLLTFILLLLTFMFNNATISNAESSADIKTNAFTGVTIAELEKQMAERLAKIERDIYVKNLIQYVEFESEIIVPDSFNAKYIEYIYTTSGKLKIPSRIAFRLVQQESRFNDMAVSPRGAKGLMQLMPNTRSTYYKSLCVDTLNLDRNQEDIYIGLTMLNEFQTYWVKKGNSTKYSWKLSLASYNAGKGNVQKYNGVPPFKETQNFVAFILKTHSNPEFFARYKKKYENQVKVNS